MSLVKFKTKSNLVKALLASGVLISTVSYMNVAHAGAQAIVNGGNTTANKLTLGDFYDYTNAGETFTIDDGYHVTADGGVSIDDTGGKGTSTLNFAGSSDVDGSIGPTTSIETINFNGVVGKTVNLNGTVQGDSLGFKNGGAVVFNAAATVNLDFTGSNNGTATFNKAYTQTAGSVNLHDTFKVIFNDNAIIPADLDLADTSGAQVFSNKTVTITNDLNTAVGSQLTFDLGSTTTPGKFVAGNNANINGNEIVNLINTADLTAYTANTAQIDPLVTDAGGTITVAPTLNPPGSNLFITYALNVPAGGKALNLVVTRTTPTGLPGNIQGVAGVLGTVTTANAAGQTALLALMNQLGGMTAAQQKEALASIAPLADGAIANTVMDLQDNTFDLFSQRISELRAGIDNYHTGYAAGSMNENGYGTWVKLFGNHVDQDRRDNVAGYTAETWGVAVGADMMITERVLVGAGLSWASVDVNHDLNSGDTDINSYRASLYGSWNFCGPMFLNWMASAAHNDYDTTRHTNVGAFNQTTLADYDGSQYGARAELGYVYGEEEFHITPTASLTYSRVELDGYREKGTSTANQFVNFDDMDALLLGLGVKFSYDHQLERAMVSPEIHANIAYDFIGDNQTSHSQFVQFGPSYETVGASPARMDYNLGLSLTTYGKSGLGISLSYDFDWKENYRAHSGFVRVRYEW